MAVFDIYTQLKCPNPPAPVSTLSPPSQTSPTSTEKMCFHKRLVFGCNHHAWLGITRPCEVEKAFDRGETEAGCAVRWSHGFDTVRIQDGCAECVRTKAGHESRLSLAKEQIKALKEHLKMIKGVSEVSEAEGQDLDSEKRGSEPSSGATGDGAATSEEADSPGGADGTGETAFGGRECRDEAMEEVRIDPQHRPLKLPGVVAGRMAKESERSPKMLSQKLDINPAGSLL